MTRTSGDALAFAGRIAAICSQVLGETVASVIAHGSLALDDYTPGDSDIDLLAVVGRPRSSRPARRDAGGGGNALGGAADRAGPRRGLSICRAHGRALIGAKPRALLARWQSLTDDAPHAVLVQGLAIQSRPQALLEGDPVRIERTEIGRLLRIVRASGQSVAR